ncbi:MAG: 3-dehydroquinate synthase [Bacteroidota bacterium]
MIHETIQVSLGDRTYPIYVGTDLNSLFASTCESHRIPKKVVVITDTTVAAQYLKPLLANLVHFKFEPASIVLPTGERQKSLRQANFAFTEMLKRGVGRTSAVVALGGGVIGDLAGFVAATYHRGVPLVQVPTTLLAQVDSSVGGKVAVNHALGKNMIGAFYQPKFVWIDASHLKTLPLREVVCGLGEIIKYGIVWDLDFFSYLEVRLDDLLRLDSQAVMHVQSRCCSIKAEIVSKDETESGLRTILNFGHTVGHALEAAGEYRLLKHGEAVLLGMVAESFIAREMGMVPGKVHQRIVDLVRRVPLKTRMTNLRAPVILRAMGRDKKSVEGINRFVLPTRIGEVRIVERVTPQHIRASLAYLKKVMN